MHAVMLQNMSAWSACQNKAAKQHNLMFPPATRTSTISKATVCSGRNKSKKKQGHVRCSCGGVFGSLNHSSSSMKNMFRNQESQFN